MTVGKVSHSSDGLSLSLDAACEDWVQPLRQSNRTLRQSNRIQMKHLDDRPQVLLSSPTSLEHWAKAKMLVRT